VMMIVSIMLAVTVPNLSPLRLKGRLRTSARSLAAMIRYARGEAVYGHRIVKVRLDLRNHRYRFDRMTDSIPASERDKDKLEPMEAIRDLSENIYFDRVILYEAAEKVRHDIVTLEFTPRGTATAASIVLSDTKGRKMTVDIFGVTGAVEVYQGTPPEMGQEH